MVGLDVLVVRPAGHVQMPVGRQFARFRVIFDVIGFDDPVAILDHNIAVKHIPAVQLRLRV